MTFSIFEHFKLSWRIHAAPFYREISCNSSQIFYSNLFFLTFVLFSDLLLQVFQSYCSSAYSGSTRGFFW